MSLALKTACTACWIAAGSLAADEPRPFSVEDMLQSERFGRALFDHDGQRLYYERHGPFGAQPDFGRFDFYRPGLFVSGSDRWNIPRPLIRRQNDGYHILGISSDGTWLAYRRASRDGEHLGVFRLDGGHMVEFAFPPQFFTTATWLGNTLLYPALPEGELRFVFAMGAEHVQALAAKWAEARAGAVSTESVLTSGRARDSRPSGEFLAWADPQTGKVHKLAEGRYVSLQPAPDGGALAMLREDRLLPDAQRLIEHGVNTGAVKRTLVVVPDPRDETSPADASPEFPCDGCDVLPDSLRWSPCSRFLGFVARRENADWSGATHFVYDSRTGTTGMARFAGLEPYRVPDPARDTFALPAAWIGNRQVVLATPLQDPADNADAPESGESRPDWYLHGGERPVNLTASFAGAIPELIAAFDFGAVFLHDGRVWLVDQEAQRRDLLPGDARPVHAWPRERDVPATRISGTTILLQVDPADSAPQLLFLDVESGEVETIAAPAPRARFVAASIRARRAAVVTRVGNTSVLSILQAGGGPHRVAQINTHLDRVAGGTPVRIDHPGPDRAGRHSWILLPPGYRDDQPLPTVVNVYPGRVGGERYRFWSIDQTSALNDHLLAAHGYAVLYPSLPIDSRRGPHDPLEGLAAEVLSAVDAAVSLGYVDADRLAIQGQSHGGYAAAGLIGLTDRFKAAMATAGIYNLISFYGVFDPRAWREVETRGLRMFGASWLETGLGRIGAPPWRDPERYLRNSPLMHVENVTTPVMLIHGDRDFVSITQAEEYFTALTRLNKEAVFVRYFGEGHAPNSPANIRDMWQRIFAWYEKHLGPPYRVAEELSDD